MKKKISNKSCMNVYVIKEFEAILKATIGLEK